MENSIIEEVIYQSLYKHRDKDYSFFISTNKNLCARSPLSKDAFFDTKIYEVEEKLTKTVLGSLWHSAGCPEILSNDGNFWYFDEVVSNINSLRSFRWFGTLTQSRLNEILDEFFEPMFKRYELQRLKQVIPTKPDQKKYLIEPERLKAVLIKNSFFELDKVNQLKVRQQDELIYLLASNKAAYQVAMMDFLGYPEYLKIIFKMSIWSRDHLLSTILSITPDEAKRQILALKTMNTRYRSFSYKKDVETDYLNLLN